MLATLETGPAPHTQPQITPVEQTLSPEAWEAQVQEAEIARQQLFTAALAAGNLHLISAIFEELDHNSSEYRYLYSQYTAAQQSGEFTPSPAENELAATPATTPENQPSRQQVLLERCRRLFHSIGRAALLGPQSEAEPVPSWRQLRKRLWNWRQEEHESLVDGRGLTVLMGLPGCGKGTLAGTLSILKGLDHLSTGDELRRLAAEAKAAEAAGQVAKTNHTDTMNGGALVNSNLIHNIVEDRMRTTNLHRLLLDGVPRTIDQVDWLVQKIGPEQVAKMTVIFMEIDEDTSRQRIAMRAIQEGRPDDAAPEVVEKRLQEYKEQTLPVIAYMEQIGIRVVRIDGKKTKEAVVEDAVQVLDQRRQELRAPKRIITLDESLFYRSRRGSRRMTAGAA